jgi:hypothetical protein
MSANKIRQQRLRRFNQNENAIKSMCNGLKITSFDNLLMHSDEIDRLLPILKLVKKHKAKMIELIKNKELIIPEIQPLPLEPNETLYNELLNRYDINKTSTKQMKFANESKTKFTKYIFNANQDLMLHHIAPDALCAIYKLKSDIDISKYSPAQKHFDIANGISKKQLKEKRERLKEKEEKAEKTEKEEKEEQEEQEATKKTTKKTTKKATKKIKKEPEPDSESDSESDIDIEEFERKEREDKDKNTPDDIRQYKKLFSKYWNQVIRDDLSSVYDYADDENDESRRHDELVDYLIPRSKNIKGKNRELGVWAVRNPKSLKKVLLSIVKSVQKKLDDYE